MFKNMLYYISIIVLVFIISLCSTSAKNTLLNINYNITLYGEVNHVTANEIISRIHQLNKINTKHPIFLFIDSPGGSLLAGTKIIDAMQQSTHPIYTVDVGMAASMAAYIHSYGDKRYMLPHAVLMYHNASTSFDEAPLNVIASRVEMLMKMMAILDMNIVNRSGNITYNQLKQNEANGWWVMTDDAMKYHLIDGVISLEYYPLSQPKSIIINK